MSSVYFDPAVGGNGSTVTDDSSPTTGLANGGHRTRFVPALSQVVAVAGNTVAKAQEALASAQQSAASAASAIAAPGTSATSTTSVAIGTGSKTFTIQTGKAFVIGQFVVVASTANVADYMFGQITSHNAGTGQLIVNVTSFAGSGTLASWSIGLSAPVAANVTTTGTQTLTNKTLTAPTVNGGSMSGVTLNDGYTEEIFSVSGTTPALSPNNGSIQTWVLSGNSVPTIGAWADGQSMTLMVDDGTAFTITWPSVTWKSNFGAAPTLNATGYTAIVLWEVGGVIYGSRIGDA